MLGLGFCFGLVFCVCACYRVWACAWVLACFSAGLWFWSVFVLWFGRRLEIGVVLRFGRASGLCFWSALVIGFELVLGFGHGPSFVLAQDNGVRL